MQKAARKEKHCDWKGSKFAVAEDVVADVDEDVDEWELGVPITSPSDSVKVSEG